MSNLKSKLAAAFIAGATLLISSSAALAASMVPTTTLNVRAGPSTHFQVVDQLHRNEQVNVQSCTQGWCYISHRGPDGWVSARYLRKAGHSYSAQQHQSTRHQRPRHQSTRYHNQRPQQQQQTWGGHSRPHTSYRQHPNRHHNVPNTQFHWRFGLYHGQ